MSDPTGVVFPLEPGTDRRSTTATGRAVVADALRAADPVGSASAERETNWRQGYLPHFRRLVEAGLVSPEAARTIARDGLTSLHERMRWIGPQGEQPLGSAFGAVGEALDSHTFTGEGAPDRILSIPDAGERLSGDRLRRRLDLWVETGIIEPSCAAAVHLVIDNPDWLNLEDRTVVVLGAAAEMGPLRSLLRWGADVAAVDLPRKDLWDKLVGDTRKLAGSITVPVRTGQEPVTARAGGDLVHDLGGMTRWVSQIDGPVVIGNYVYADGETNVRRCAPSAGAGCCDATTCPVRVRASTTVWCCSRARTTCWPNGSSGGVRPATDRRAGWSRSTWRLPPAPGRW